MLLVSGSLRSGSTNAAVLRTAQTVAPADMECVLYDGLGVLPHFNPDDDADPLPPAVAELRNLVHRADALVICTPEYTGGAAGLPQEPPGVAHRGWRRPLHLPQAGRLDQCLARSATDAQDALRKVLGYAHATLLDEVSAEVPVSAPLIGADGEIHDEPVRGQIRDMMARLRDALVAGRRKDDRW